MLEGRNMHHWPGLRSRAAAVEGKESFSYLERSKAALEVKP